MQWSNLIFVDFSFLMAPVLKTKDENSVEKINVDKFDSHEVRVGVA